MDVTLLSPENQAVFLARIAALRADSPRRFGTMTPAAMLAHASHTIAMSLGEVLFKDSSNFITRRRWFVVLTFRYMPWPEGKIKAPPVFFPERVGDFEAERARLIAAIERFLAALRRDPHGLGFSPMLGGQPLTLWRLIHGRHLDHHLKQFGA